VDLCCCCCCCGVKDGGGDVPISIRPLLEGGGDESDNDVGDPAVTLSSSFPYADTSLLGTARMVVGKPRGAGVRDCRVGEDRLVMGGEAGAAGVLLLELARIVFGTLVVVMVVVDGGLVSLGGTALVAEESALPAVVVIRC